MKRYSLPPNSPPEVALVVRAQILLEDGEHDSAEEKLEQALDLNPLYAPAYFTKLLMMNNVCNADELLKLDIDISKEKLFKRALQFSDVEYATELKQLLSTNKKNLEAKKKALLKEKADKEKALKTYKEFYKWWNNIYGNGDYDESDDNEPDEYYDNIDVWGPKEAIALYLEYLVDIIINKGESYLYSHEIVRKIFMTERWDEVMDEKARFLKYDLELLFEHTHVVMPKIMETSEDVKSLYQNPIIQANPIYLKRFNRAVEEVFDMATYSFWGKADDELCNTAHCYSLIADYYLGEDGLEKLLKMGSEDEIIPLFIQHYGYKYSIEECVNAIVREKPITELI